MDPSSAEINSPTGNASAAVQRDVRALYIAGIPVLSLAFLISAIRPLFEPFGINVDRLLETTQQQAPAEAEVAHKCPICLGAYVGPIAIKVCGHVFCSSCLAQAVKNPKKCPMCRTYFTKRHLFRIYLN